MKKGIKEILILTVAAVTMASCHASVSGGSSALPIDAQPQTWSKDSVSGPDVTGAWSSACVASPFQSNQWRKMAIQFATDHVTHVYGEYSDAGCTTSTRLENYSGLFHYIAKNSDGTFEIEYRFDLKNGVSEIIEEKLLLANNQLFVSNFVYGDSADVMRDLPMALGGTQTTTPPPAPQPEPTQPAPASCVKLAGTYQMNSDYFTLTQASDCSSVVWNWVYPAASTTTLQTDGVVHGVNNQNVKAYYVANNLMVETTDASGNIEKDQYDMNTSPCNLANPDGTMYLEKVVTYNGTVQPDQCQFWAPNNN